MAFVQNLVAVVKVGGRVLREQGGVVRLPFGSDYSLSFKNLDARRAVIRVEIDGQLVSGGGLVLNGGASVDLDGFMDGWCVRHRFRFIRKTQEVREHRGDRLDDGMVRVVFQFEEPWTHHYISHVPKLWEPYPFPWPPSSVGVPLVHYECTCSADQGKSCLFSQPAPDEGITVRGEDARQHFSPTWVGTLGPEQVIVLQLRGAVTRYRMVDFPHTEFSGEDVQRDGERFVVSLDTDKGRILAPVFEVVEHVAAPVTSRQRLKCSSCGRESKSSFKFCPGCGTRLEG
jgi:diadenosine tetraphosphatase ApaH/serine/threonine PP2A family protein phosphatase